MVCILVEMGTLLEIAHIEQDGVTLLHGNSYCFNGNSGLRIYSEAQLKLYQRDEKRMDAALKEVGWVAGAVINLVRSTKSRNEDLPRLKFSLLQPPIVHVEESQPREYIPLLSLMFMIDADILQPIKTV